MAGMLPRVLAVFSTLILCITLSGCGDDRPEKITQYQQLSQQRLSQLDSMLKAGELRNATLLTQYTRLLKSSKPDLVPLLDELSRDATSNGPMFQSLKRRTSELADSANFVDLDQQLEEAQNIYQAADSSLFNDMLSDPVNVVADLSGGQLARVNSISREAAALANGSEDFGAGSQLVGNPSYGGWQTNSSGMSIWAWYGMYSMFSNVMNPVRYDRWSGNRGYSYYNDVGRYRYTSPKQASAQNRTFENTKKTYNSQGRQFNSPYAKSRTGSTSLSRQSTATPKASTTGTRTANRSSKFRSNYSKDSSFRNSSNRTTRGVRRGK